MALGPKAAFIQPAHVSAASCTSTARRSATRASTRSSRDAGAAASCTLRTDSAGRVDVRVANGPSRTLRVSFAGDALLLPARDSVAIRTPARARLHAGPRAVAARRGGALHRPPFSAPTCARAGKLVELQARVDSGWADVRDLAL
jgi:hypothetical protein